MAQKYRALLLFFIGVISFILSIFCFNYEKLDYEPHSAYGGDAFTGIQNAAAQTSKNVKILADIVQFGFGSVLLVTGLAFMTIGLTTPMAMKLDDESPVFDSDEEPTLIEEDTEA